MQGRSKTSAFILGLSLLAGLVLLGFQLGKIKNASQGQFTISNRDANNPHIKRVRVVSTVEYYLSD